MFGSLVLDRVSGEVNDTDVVAVDNGGSLQRTVKLLKHLPQPTSLDDTISNNLVLDRLQHWIKKMSTDTWKTKR
jgi:hypothetical protein